MIPLGTILEVGQKIIKIRKSNKISYWTIEISHAYNENYYAYKHNERRDKTGSVNIDRSEDYFLTKFEFLKDVFYKLQIQKAKIEKLNHPNKRPFDPLNYTTKQVIEELNAHQKKYPEYWV